MQIECVCVDFGNEEATHCSIEPLSGGWVEQALIDSFWLKKGSFFLSLHCKTSALLFFQSTYCVCDRLVCVLFFHLFDNLSIKLSTIRITKFHSFTAMRRIRTFVQMLFFKCFSISKMSFWKNKYTKINLNCHGIRKFNKIKQMNVLLWRLTSSSIVWLKIIRHEIAHGVYSNFDCRWRCTTN